IRCHRTASVPTPWRCLDPCLARSLLGISDRAGNAGKDTVYVCRPRGTGDTVEAGQAATQARLRHLLSERSRRGRPDVGEADRDADQLSPEVLSDPITD